MFILAANFPPTSSKQLTFDLIFTLEKFRESCVNKIHGLI